MYVRTGIKVHRSIIKRLYRAIHRSCNNNSTITTKETSGHNQITTTTTNKNQTITNKNKATTVTVSKN